MATYLINVPQRSIKVIAPLKDINPKAYRHMFKAIESSGNLNRLIMDFHSCDDLNVGLIESAKKLKRLTNF